MNIQYVPGNVSAMVSPLLAGFTVFSHGCVILHLPPNAFPLRRTLKLDFNLITSSMALSLYMVTHLLTDSAFTHKYKIWCAVFYPITPFTMKKHLINPLSQLGKSMGFFITTTCDVELREYLFFSGIWWIFSAFSFPLANWIHASLIFLCGQRHGMGK